MRDPDRRLNQRLPMKLPIILRKRAGSGDMILRGVTENISTDGFYIETDVADVHVRDEFDLDLTLPPADGVSAFEGHARTIGEILRVTELPSGAGAKHFGIGGRFREPLKLNY